MPSQWFTLNSQSVGGILSRTLPTTQICVMAPYRGWGFWKNWRFAKAGDMDPKSMDLLGIFGLGTRFSKKKTSFSKPSTLTECHHAVLRCWIYAWLITIIKETIVKKCRVLDSTTRLKPPEHMLQIYKCCWFPILSEVGRDRQAVTE